MLPGFLALYIKGPCLSIVLIVILVLQVEWNYTTIFANTQLPLKLLRTIHLGYFSCYCYMPCFKFIFSQINATVTVAHPILRSNQEHTQISTRMLPILFLEKNVAISKLLLLKKTTCLEANYARGKKKSNNT